MAAMTREWRERVEAESRELRHLVRWLNEHGVDDARPGRSFECPVKYHRHDAERLHARIDETGVKPYVHCFRCNECWSLIDLIGIVDCKVDPKAEFDTALAATAEFVGVPLEGERPFPPRGAGLALPPSSGTTSDAPKAERDAERAKKKAEAEKKAAKIVELGRQGAGDPRRSEYLRGRGIDPKVADRLGVGFLGECYAHNGLPALTFPNDRGGVTTGITCPRDDKRVVDEKIRKYKTHGCKGLFNAGAIHAAEAEGVPLYVTEGELDAVSVEQAGRRAVGLSSAANRKALAEAVPEGYPSPVLLLLDADGTGDGATADLLEALKRRGADAADVRRRALPEGCKDPNDALRLDPEGFARGLAEAAAEAARELAEAAEVEVAVAEVEWADVVRVGPRGGERFAHELCGRTFIDKLHACRVGGEDGPLALMVGDRYEVGQRAVGRAVREAHKPATKRDIEEVTGYLRDMAPVRPEAPEGLMLFDNGALDWRTGELRDPGPDDLFLNPVPHRWDPDADTSFVRAYLLGLACGDPGVAANLAEAAGLALYRGARFRTAVLLLGKGRNGKSTYLDAVRAAVGEANCSAVSIQTMGDPFGPADLHGKLLNVVDDLPVEFATGQALGAFKTAVSGGLMRCNPKNRDAFAFKPYAQWLVAANEIPRMGDTTEGVWDRLHVVKFNRRFEPWEHDPGLAGRLTGEAGCEALIRLGVEALRGVEDRGCMTETDAGKEARQAARAESDNVLQWLESDEFDRTTFVGELGAEGGRRSTTKTYAEYREWCESAGCVAVSMARFVPRLCGLLPLKTAQLDYPRGSRGNRVKCFVPIEGE